MLILPWENTATIAGVASGTTGFEVSLVIRLHCIAFGASLTYPLFVVAMFPPEMLLDPNKVTQGMTRVMVQASWFRAHKHSFSNHWCLPLQKLPWHLVPPPMHLQVLVPLESLVADLTHITIWFQQSLWWERHHLCIWICITWTQKQYN